MATKLTLTIEIPDTASVDARTFHEILWGCLFDMDRALSDETEDWTITAEYEENN